MDIIMYSTGCPKCKVLKAKLNQKNIPFIECNDITIIQSKGIEKLPVLEIDGTLHEFKDAVELINRGEI